MQLIADEMGLSYTMKIPGTKDVPFSKAALFNVGDTPICRHVMRGKVGEVDVMLLDYQYWQRSNESRTMTMTTVVAFCDAQAPVPDFCLGLESFVTRMAQKLGFTDINFDTHEQFSKTYRLTGKDEQAIRGLFTPDLLADFENGKIERNCRIQAADNWMFFYRDGKRVKPEELKDFFARSFDLMNRMTAPGVMR
jgi:hypothetical protein